MRIKVGKEEQDPNKRREVTMGRAKKNEEPTRILTRLGNGGRLLAIVSHIDAIESTTHWRVGAMWRWPHHSSPFRASV